MEKKTELEKTAFCVITFAPIEVQTHSTSQNDRLNLSFVKGTYGNAEKMARKGGKMMMKDIASLNN